MCVCVYVQHFIYTYTGTTTIVDNLCVIQKENVLVVIRCFGKCVRWCGYIRERKLSLNMSVIICI